MQDKLIIRNNSVLFLGPNKYKIKYNSREELCDFLFSFFNSSEYAKIYLNKKVDFKNNNSYKIIKEGTYFNPDGIYKLRLVVDKEQLNTIKGFMYQFNYSKVKDEKQLILK